MSSQKGKLSLSDIERLLKECPGRREKEMVLETLKRSKAPRKNRSGWREIRQNIVLAANRIGLINFEMSQLKVASRSRLANDLMQEYADRALEDIEGQKPESQDCPENNLNPDCKNCTIVA